MRTVLPAASSSIDCLPFSMVHCILALTDRPEGGGNVIAPKRIRAPPVRVTRTPMTGLVARSRLENALEDVEQRTLGELEFLREPLRQSVHAAITCDCELAAKVAAEQAEIDRR